MIVLWGLAEDGPIASVTQCLRDLGVPVTFIDQRRVREYSLEYDLDAGSGGRILAPDGVVELDEIQSIYVRPYNLADLDTFSGVDPSSDTWKWAVQFEDSILSWCDISPAFVVNRPASMGSNTSKPYQLEMIRRTGFEIPETLITTDPEAVSKFWQKHGQIIYKSISSWRSIVSKLTEEDRSRLHDVVCCPTQFQEFIVGTDYRVHVVNGTAFAHEIQCADDDYRYSRQTTIIPATLDESVERRCVRLAQEIGLAFAGIDLRLAADGKWYCFEVNPSPGFTYFDRASGDISRALARELILHEA